MKFDALAKDFNDLRAFKAQDDLRRATVPADANAYNHTIPNEIEWPKTAKGETVKFEIAADDPALAEFKKFAHADGWPQERLTKTLSLYARMRATEDAMIANARDEQVTKLGANGPARVDAVTRVLHAKLGNDKGQAIIDRMALSTDFEALEDLVKLITTGGNSSMTQLHREVHTEKWDEQAYQQSGPPGSTGRAEYAAKHAPRQTNAH